MKLSWKASVDRLKATAPLKSMTRRGFLERLQHVSLLGVGTGAYTWLWEPHWVEVVQRPLRIASLPDDLIGKRLVQLSDLHIGAKVDDGYLREAFDRVRDLAPEIVVYTGDFTTYEEGILGRAQEMFPFLPHGRSGTAGVLGNHDYGRWYRNKQVADGLALRAEAAGVRILRNDKLSIKGLQIVGLDDLWSKRFDAHKGLGTLQRDQAAIVLSHNPDTVDLPVWEDYSGWILCGHTHGGQCKAPFLPPPMLPVKNRNYTAGEFSLPGGRKMYINRGIGHLMRVRFNARPEITCFTLERA
jgi:predicted MPP superfamily phosphohydrolase